jgi:hypothetical protein
MEQHMWLAPKYVKITYPMFVVNFVHCIYILHNDYYSMLFYKSILVKAPNQKKEHLPSLYNRTVPNGQKPYETSATMEMVKK